MTIIVIFAAAIMLFTAATSRAVDGSKGFRAPMFRIEQADSTVELDDMKGQWVLLNFWASYDAQSRIDARQYTLMQSRLNEADTASARQQIRLLSVNLDRSERLFRETVRRDGLNANSQFYAEGNRAERLKADYHLEKGMNSYLIDPRGRIVAVNPTESQLQSLTQR